MNHLLQVKGQRKDQKNQNLKPKVEKQEVEIRQGMTAAALAAAMNRDFGKNLRVTSRLFLVLMTDGLVLLKITF